MKSQSLVADNPCTPKINNIGIKVMILVASCTRKVNRGGMQEGRYWLTYALQAKEIKNEVEVMVNSRLRTKLEIMVNSSRMKVASIAVKELNGTFLVHFAGSYRFLR